MTTSEAMHTSRAMDTSFAHSYNCEQMTELPNVSLPHFYFPGSTTHGGRDGILVQVFPEQGDIWFGTFAFGRLSPNGLSGLFSTPSAGRFCVVAKGEGYLVTANARENWESVEIKPIMDVRAVVTHSLLIFADFSRLAAYGPSGLKWRSDRIGSDGVKIAGITDTSVHVKSWDAARQATTHVVVDLANGSQKASNSN